MTTTYSLLLPLERCANKELSDGSGSVIYLGEPRHEVWQITYLKAQGASSQRRQIVSFALEMSLGGGGGFINGGASVPSLGSIFCRAPMERIWAVHDSECGLTLDVDCCRGISQCLKMIQFL